MALTEQNIRVFRGDALRVWVPVRDPAGNRIDLSGVTDIKWAVATGVDATVAELQKTYTGGDITLPHAYKLVFLLSGADTAALTDTGNGTGYYHEARVIRGDGNPYTILTGRLYVRPSLNEGL